MSQLCKLEHPLTAIPTGDLAKFSKETDACRREVLAWLAVLTPLRGLKGRSSMFAAVGRLFKVSEGTARTKYYALEKHGWQALINRSKHPAPATGNLHPAFIDFWKSEQERHQRDDTGRQAARMLLHRIDQWTKTNDPKYAIPGYTTPPPCDSWCGTLRRDVPTGLSYRNLIRHKPRTINLILRRRGPKAAAAHLPNNYSTRAGLRLLERVFFDDQEYDTKVVLPGNHGNAKPMRPMGFNAIDHLTGKFIYQTVKLTRYDLEEKKKKQLNQQDFVWMVINTLQQVGYRTDSTGTTFIFEHGTASGYKKNKYPDKGSFDEAIHHITGCNVTVDRSGLYGQPMSAAMHFKGSSSGNFRYKAPLESIFKLVRITLATIPGATGRHFGAKPEESYGLDAYGSEMLKLYNTLPHDIAEDIRLPFFTFNEFLQIANAVYHKLNHRLDHNLEGWQSAGFISPEWRLSSDTPWQPRSTYLALSPENQAISRDIIEQRTRYMTPAEAWSHQYRLDQKNITKLKEEHIPSLIPLDWAYPVKVTRQSEIIIRNQHMDPEPMIYPSSITEGSTTTHLRPGTHYKALLNPYNPDRLLLIDNDGRYIGALDRFIKPTASDHHAIVRNQGRINQFAADVTAPAKRRAQGVAAERQEMIKHNDLIKQGRPTTRAGISVEKKAQRRAKKSETSFDKLIKSSPTQPAQQPQNPTPELPDEPFDI